MSKTKEEPKSKTKNNTKNIVATIVLVVISVAFGYFLGSFFGLDFTENNSKWAGTYTTDRWNTYESVKLVLNEDGTCERPKTYNDDCVYKVKNGQVYFNGESSSSTAIGEDGIVYKNVRFQKLK